MDIGFTVEELAARTDQAPWLVARSLARLIEKGLVQVDGGTAAQAVAELRARSIPTPSADADG